jgi:hypothetical protein
VAFGPPLVDLGATPLPHFFFSFFFFLSFFFFKKRKYIYLFFLINLYYFIKMCMSEPRVANKMATRGADVAFEEIC